MAVTDFVTLTLQVNNQGVSQQGFGTGLLVSYGASFTGVRTYGQIADVLVDFATGTPEYDAAAAYFGQSPHPLQLKIGAGTLKPTLQYTIGAIVVNNSYAYQVQVDGPGITSTLASFTSDSTATKQEIHNGLVAAMNTVVGKNYTATFAPLATLTPFTFTANSVNDQCTAAAHGLNTGDGPVQVSNSGGALPSGLLAATNYWIIKVDANTFMFATSLANALAGTQIDLTTNGTGTQTLTPQAGCLSPILPFLATANSAGAWFSAEVKGNAAVLSNKMSHSDPGVATDLASFAVADSDWYCLLTQWNSRAYVLAAAAWVETQVKIYPVAVVDTDALNTALTNNDTLDALNTLGYKRTEGKWHPSPLQCFDVASAGAILALNPGTWTEAFKTLSGVAVQSISPTQRNNLKLRRSGTYTLEKGRSITWDGKVFNTVYGFLDNVVSTDWFSDAVVSAAFGAMVSKPKVSYTDEDIDFIAGAVRGVLALATSDAFKVLDPGDPNDPTNLPPSITFPKVSQIAAGSRALRNLPNGTIIGRIQGAVQSINFIATLTF